MTAELYHVFYQVAEYESISKAAKALFVSQPAISKSIRNLEADLGVLLFVRHAKGVTLTKEGQLLYDHVATAFRQIHEGEKLLHQLRDKSFGAIRIGISNTLCKYYFMPFLNRFHQVYPKLKIEIVNRTSLETMKLLEEGFLDCAIISDLKADQAFEYIQLMMIQDIFVSRQRPPKEVIPLKELEKHPMLLLERNNATRDHLEHFLERHHITLNVDIEISSMEFLVEFAKIGLGVASVIGNFVSEDLKNKNIYEWPVVPMIPQRSIGLLYNKKRGVSIACTTFIEFMKTDNDI
ncbi:LysR family transcriptional regulator [Petrocella sp. FN5]|uniref:LysR family transcriptional regulator n=1 Tax=Petrocella sp. FN5 TaxID=3032002 RepID=UPI0023DB9A53|nr:LysR family transcriptional regulator [Petrocella sp. FN5]MDF1616654.1 LysR family transcriptional regulator [Petrocella sp. FN5]